MAVARIKMSRRWFEGTADRLPDPDGRLARELRRAAQRPGLTAEVTPDELTQLEAVDRADAPPADRASLAVLVEAREAMNAALEEDARRNADRKNHPQDRSRAHG